MTEQIWNSQEELKQYIREEMESQKDLHDNELFKHALRQCTDDEFLYLVAENAPHLIIEEIAASGIRSKEYRYAMICSNLRGRYALIHDLAVNRELDEQTAKRILLVDDWEENKNDAMHVINDEALLMLACLKSFSLRAAAVRRLKEIGSPYPDRYYSELGQEEKESIRMEWFRKACADAEQLLETDQKMDQALSDQVEIISDMLIGFLAACHPVPEKRIFYAEQTTSETIAAYAGSVTEYDDVRSILSAKIHREDLIDLLSFPYSFDEEPFLIPDTEEKRSAFCHEVFRNRNTAQ